MHLLMIGCQRLADLLSTYSTTSTAHITALKKTRAFATYLGKSRLNIFFIKKLINYMTLHVELMLFPLNKNELLLKTHH